MLTTRHKILLIRKTCSTCLLPTFCSHYIHLMAIYNQCIRLE
uniref:Uncharacterized protein n=1 Tax=Arundo donax TaxID=35708 RepID=A0A0A9AJ82_ARUDO